jgi:hypothetical protein
MSPPAAISGLERLLLVLAMLSAALVFFDHPAGEYCQAIVCARAAKNFGAGLFHV